ncbi:MAG TPA: hypothetical protein EYF95_01805 [Flavobacteriales bacterium]|nr:hypothetical protein [Flavobacteriales bacterium]
MGEVLDLIQQLQDDADSTDIATRAANVGLEFIKIAMGEIPIVGGALGAADGLFAMYEAGKNEEHTWAELEEYPILARMKMHPDLAKHLDPITLREVDKAYQQYLTTLGRKTRITDIRDIDIFTQDWIKSDTGGNLSIELLREYVRILLREANEYDWSVASKKNMLLDKEGMEQEDKDNQEEYLKSMSLMELNLGQGYGIEYTALVLDEASHQKLAAFAPEGWKVFAHHMTIISPPNQKRRLPGRWLGQELSLTVTGIAQGVMVMTALVDLGGSLLPMKGPEYPHVTIATNLAEGGKPAMSNWKFKPVFDKDNFEAIGPIVITGTIEEVLK